MVLVLSCDSCSLLARYGVPQIQGMLWFFCYPVIVVASWLVMEYLRYKVGLVLVLSCDSCSLLASYGVPQIQDRLWFLCYPVIVVASWLVMEYLRYKVGYGSCVIL